MSLRRPYLWSVAAFFILMAIAIECLRQYSDYHHGLIHLKSYTVLGEFTSGMYTYAPTAFAVLAAALWNVCALDVLRLEPYFQLAKPEGTSAVILFTNYCFFYGIVTPIMAVRNRHWIVAGVSSMAMILRMMLPSLLSGLVVLTEANIVSWKPISIWPGLVSLEAQNAWFSDQVSRSKNGSIIDTDTFLFYTNLDYALPPISRPGNWAYPLDSTWELHHPVYWSDLHCTDVSLDDIVPRKWFRSNSTRMSWDIRNVQLDIPSGATTDPKCTINIAFNSSLPARQGKSRLRHWEPLDPSGSTGAPSAFTYTGCASMSLIGLEIDVNTLPYNSRPSNATVFGCSSTYSHTTAEVLLPVNTSLATVRDLSRQKTSSTSKELDLSGFQNMLHTKYLNGDLKLWEMAVPHPLAALTGSMGTGEGSADETSPESPASYQQKIRHVWNRHFVLAMNNFFDTAANPKHVIAKEVTTKIIFGVDSKPAFIAEAILLTAFLALLAMSRLYPRRPNFLQADPGSIAAQCAIVTDVLASTECLTQSNMDFHQATPRQLRRFARSLWCRWIDEPTGRRISISPCKQPQFSGVQKRARARPNVRPHFLKPLVFFIECSLVAGALSAFGVSVQYLRMDKFSYLTPGATFLFLYLIYGPTVIASMISSLFTSVHRHLSYMEPWIRLQEGMALAGQSLTVNYASHTPVTIWRTFRRNRPFLLIVSSFVCLLDFLLIIVSSGMFEPTVYHWSDVTKDLTTGYNHSRFFNPEVGIRFRGHNLVADTLTSGDSLLAWTTANTSFFPFTIDSEDADYVDWMMYTARTRGIGVELQCMEIPSGDSWVSFGKRYWTYSPGKHPSSTNCTVDFQSGKYDSHSPNGSVHLTTSGQADPSCQRSFVVINFTDTGDGQMAHESSPTAFHCEPQVQIQEFEIDFDPVGLIKRQRPVPGSAITSGPMFENASSSLVPFNQAIVRQLDWSVLLSQQFHASLNTKPTDLIQFRDQSEDQSLRAIQLIYQSAFSIYTSLWRHLYLESLPPRSQQAPVNATAAEAIWSIDPSNIVIITMIIFLSIDLSLLIAVFWLRHKHYNGPPTPRSIGSLIPWISSSRMLFDIRETAEWSEARRQEHLEVLQRRYRFGEFNCPSGSGRVSKVALDWDEKVVEDERGEDLEMPCISPEPASREEPGIEASLVVTGSETMLVDTHTVGHRM